MVIISIVQLDYEWIKKVMSQCYEEIIVTDKDELKLEQIKSCNVLIARDRDLNEEFLDAFLCLKFIFIVSDGVEKLPFKYLYDKNIRVANTPGISDDAMSDYVMGAMLNFSCKFLDCFHYKQKRYWQKFLMTESLNKKTLMVVGAGRVGKKIAKKAKAMGMKIIGVKKNICQLEYFDEVCSISDMKNFLSLCDFIVCACPLTDETYHLFNNDIFSMFSEKTVFINISRGKLVDETALIASLETKKIKGAVLDVFETEPLSDESKLWRFDNVIITPHSSGRIENFLKFSIDIFIENLISYKNNGNLATEIDLCRGY